MFTNINKYPQISKELTNNNKCLQIAQMSISINTYQHSTESTHIYDNIITHIKSCQTLTINITKSFSNMDNHQKIKTNIKNNHRCKPIATNIGE